MSEFKYRPTLDYLNPALNNSALADFWHVPGDLSSKNKRYLNNCSVWNGRIATPAQVWQASFEDPKLVIVCQSLNGTDNKASVGNKKPEINMINL